MEKLLRAGAGWLADHPAKELITRRYLNYRQSLTQSALERLKAADDLPEPEPTEPPDEPAEPQKPLVRHRKEAVLAALAESGASRVLDLGCGQGALLLDLQNLPGYAEIVGVDVSTGNLQIAERRLKLDRLPERQRGRIKLLQSALTYHDDRLAGYDAAVLMEVIEHVDEARLPALEQAVFGHAAPQTVLVTTPNVEYNVRYEALDDLRHEDHRFEWTRAQFTTWAERVAGRHGYSVEIRPVGDIDPEVGSPTQLALFRKVAAQ